jgi:hypothetical protein
MLEQDSARPQHNDLTNWAKAQFSFKPVSFRATVVNGIRSKHRSPLMMCVPDHGVVAWLRIQSMVAFKEPSVLDPIRCLC